MKVVPIQVTIYFETTKRFSLVPVNIFLKFQTISSAFPSSDSNIKLETYCFNLKNQRGPLSVTSFREEVKRMKNNFDYAVFLLPTVWQWQHQS